MGKKHKFTQQISSAKGQTERPPKYILWCIPKGSKKLPFFPMGKKKKHNT